MNDERPVGQIRFRVRIEPQFFERLTVELHLTRHAQVTNVDESRKQIQVSRQRREFFPAADFALRPTHEKRYTMTAFLLGGLGAAEPAIETDPVIASFF